jgi:hypothetical protein
MKERLKEDGNKRLKRNAWQRTMIMMLMILLTLKRIYHLITGHREGLGKEVPEAKAPQRKGEMYIWKMQILF